ncbi:thioredoxin-dependent thiol peroxidase [Helicobacter ailurogastricus]|uniref:Putative peroxiredoxin bcp n=1 Tax=Helicobacter ailurogastricus TaxID=1578720 RepID=A0A0K2XIX0_9HELI|nr:thioredoxin-dependent thiol peroxidase [Helicobacter ailurogastricus]CRF40588.1 Thiol peroxidase, Bcp-type [Helicobacter ailurogastricus]CRF42242.1 Thiol peroxidase, Bcp-type [Helicobacter ailurogastricus]CRF44684.1 Thiol peroxidase, Bcp-type [Helicobacter ailurogastricus]
MRLEKGSPAPAFTLNNATGQSVSLKDFLGKVVVLYFYPKDNTPGCTLEAQDFTKLKAEFGAKGAVILGVSADDAKSHCHFIESENLGIELLSDPNHEVAKAYGAYGEKNLYGKVSVGLIRSTFVIDQEGKIAHALYNVQAKGHAQKVLGLL